MSLLDDVSIVVTPNGYKAGTLYGVLPTYIEGSELVTNGDFATDSDWTKGTGWTISGGKASNDGSHLSTSNLFQNVTDLSNKSVKLVFTVSDYTAGTLSPSFFGASGTTGTVNVNANGVYTQFVNVSNGHNGNVGFSAFTTFAGSVTDISIKEVTRSDMDVTRATAATRVDENGLVNYAEIIGDEEVNNGDFSNGTTNWQVSDYGSIAASASLSIDNGAVKILKTADRDWRSSFLRQTITYTVGSQYEVKFKIKDGNLTSPNIYLRNNFDTSANTIKASVPITSSFVEHTYYFTADSNSTDISIGNVEWNNFGSGQFFFVDDVSVKEITRNNVPRIDYTGGGCPHILAEPQRTNLVTTSASGTYGNSPASEILAISPDNTNTAIRPVPDSVADRYEKLIAGGTYATGTKLTYSWYRKRISTPTGTIIVGDLEIKSLVNLTELEVDNAREIASDINGFDRFATVVEIVDGSLDSRFRAYFGSIIEVGNSSVAYWGHQYEVGSYATSYITTSGSTVTRNADIFQRDGIASLIGQTAGTIYWEIDVETTVATANENILNIDAGSFGNTIYFIKTATGNITAEIYVSTSVQASFTKTNITKGVHKIALGYANNNTACFIDGVQVGVTDTSCTIPATNRVQFGSGALGASDGKIKNLQLYKTRLTNTQLAALTS